MEGKQEHLEEAMEESPSNQPPVCSLTCVLPLFLLQPSLVSYEAHLEEVVMVLPIVLIHF